MDLRGWNVVDRERAILWREYEFTKGAYATTLVFRGTDGLVVVSPGNGLEPADYDALSEFGEVRALVANTSTHNLGQAPWRARFPKAESYASNAAMAKLQKKAASVPFRPLDELAMPAGVKVHTLPGWKTGDVMFTMNTSAGSLWFTSDLLTNFKRAPRPPIGWLFRWSGSAPGYRLFKLAVWAFVNDRRALKARMETLVAEDPPAIIVPGHGPAFATGDVAAETRVQLARL